MRFLRIVMVFIAIISLGCMADNSEESFQLYWTEFRTAVLAEDYKKLETLTQFPLYVRGVDDSMPTIQYKKKQFRNVFKRIMQQTVYRPHEGDFRETTVGTIIKDTPAVSGVVENNEVRVEQLEFENIEGRWFLVRAYLEE